jgi:hypothetical protein
MPTLIGMKFLLALFVFAMIAGCGEPVDTTGTATTTSPNKLKGGGQQPAE